MIFFPFPEYKGERPIKETVMKWINKDFRNAYLMGGIMLAMFLFMGVSMFYIGDHVGKNRSCVTTCDIQIEKGDKG